jgi:FAD/FMN-containing dehydrogenase
LISFQLNLYFAWSNATNDAYWNEAMQGSVARLKKVARALDIYDDDFTVYPNYANSNTTAEELYGANTKRLREIKAQIDPKGIMELAGGFDL